MGFSVTSAVTQKARLNLARPVWKTQLQLRPPPWQGLDQNISTLLTCPVFVYHAAAGNIGSVPVSCQSAGTAHVGQQKQDRVNLALLECC